MKIFFSQGCPYAQRTRALLTLLKQPFEEREIDLASKPDDFKKLSVTGRVPLLEDDGFVLYESSVINGYLAEHFAWKSAFSDDVKQRALEHLAMKQFDDTLVPLFFKGLRDPGAYTKDDVWQREVEAISRTVTKSKPESLPGIHMATHWQRWNWVAPKSPLVEKIRVTPLGAFLDEAAQLPAVLATTPDREATTKLILEKFGPKA